MPVDVVHYSYNRCLIPDPFAITTKTLPPDLLAQFPPSRPSAVLPSCKCRSSRGLWTRATWFPEVPALASPYLGSRGTTPSSRTAILASLTSPQPTYPRNLCRRHLQPGRITALTCIQQFSKITPSCVVSSSCTSRVLPLLPHLGNHPWPLLRRPWLLSPGYWVLRAPLHYADQGALPFFSYPLTSCRGRATRHDLHYQHKTKSWPLLLLHLRLGATSWSKLFFRLGASHLHVLLGCLALPYYLLLLLLLYCS